VALANDSGFRVGGLGLHQGMWARRKRVASRIDTGMVFITSPDLDEPPDLPFGASRNPGYGAELSSLGIQEFVNKSLVRVASIDAPA